MFGKNEDTIENKIIKFFVRGLSWQLTTSDPKDSTPVRDSLLGTALEKPHTIVHVLACARRSFEYSTE